MLRLIRFATAAEQRRPWRALFTVLLAAITWLALVPHPPATLSTGWDKSNHALAFASLAFTSVWAWWPRPRQWGWLAASLLAYGVGIEIAQCFLPTRSADALDVLADAVGLAFGLCAAWPLALRTATRGN